MFYCVFTTFTNYMKFFDVWPLSKVGQICNFSSPWDFLLFIIARPLVVVEYAQYGDLLGYLRKSRGVHDNYYSDPSVKPRSTLTSKQLLKFAWEVSDGMEYLSMKKVTCIRFWNCDPAVCWKSSNLKLIWDSCGFIQLVLEILTRLMITNSLQFLATFNLSLRKFATFEQALR